MKIYSVSTVYCYAFCANVPKEVALQFLKLPNIDVIIPDSYYDVANKIYGDNLWRTRFYYLPHMPSGGMLYRLPPNMGGVPQGNYGGMPPPNNTGMTPNAGRSSNTLENMQQNNRSANTVPE
ncbi:hypothetical protein Q3G72_018462 [Acer saccharum]|nr:hypothetical protein Q3G72_007442 [Acer saccharum]KAK1559805.1 hypothetical protein Q3G72_018462 [Acer saccharum]